MVWGKYSIFGVLCLSHIMCVTGEALTYPYERCFE